MNATQIVILDITLLESKAPGDYEGCFRSFNQAQFETAVSKKVNPVQSRYIRFIKTELFDLHCQIKRSKEVPMLFSKDMRAGEFKITEVFA